MHFIFAVNIWVSKYNAVESTRTVADFLYTDTVAWR